MQHYISNCLKVKRMSFRNTVYHGGESPTTSLRQKEKMLQLRPILGRNTDVVFLYSHCDCIIIL